MNTYPIYAVIFESIVKKLIIADYPEANAAAVGEYGPDAFAINVSDRNIPVAIDDAYEDGIFKRLVDGEWVTIDPIPTPDEEIASLKATNSQLVEIINTLSGAVTDMFEMIEDS